jgi:large subunit ribosomal protein L14e
MEISKADIVLSLAGHDREQVFFVVDTDGVWAWLADGRGRKLEKPKRKKLKHVRFVSRTDSRVAEKLRSGDKVLNSELRRELAAFGQKFNSQNQGGI